MENNTVARRSFDSFLSSLGIEIAPSIEVGSWELMKRLVARGMGIGVIPKEYAKQAPQPQSASINGQGGGQVRGYRARRRTFRLFDGT